MVAAAGEGANLIDCAELTGVVAQERARDFVFQPPFQAGRVTLINPCAQLLLELRKGRGVKVALQLLGNDQHLGDRGTDARVTAEGAPRLALHVLRNGEGLCGRGKLLHSVGQHRDAQPVLGNGLGDELHGLLKALAQVFVGLSGGVAFLGGWCLVCHEGSLAQGSGFRVLNAL